MRTTENTTNPPRIIIDAAGHNYQVHLHAVSEFIENIGSLEVKDKPGIEHKLTLMRSFILQGSKATGLCQELPDVLLFIDELNFLFKGLFKQED